MPKALFLALTNVAPGADEDEFNRWYEEHHVTDLLREIAPIVAATRYRLADVEMMPGMPQLQQRYITAYEVEAETEKDLNQLAEALRTTLTSGKVDISPTLDMNTSISAFLLPISERRTV